MQMHARRRTAVAGVTDQVALFYREPLLRRKERDGKGTAGILLLFDIILNILPKLPHVAVNGHGRPKSRMGNIQHVPVAVGAHSDPRNITVRRRVNIGLAPRHPDIHSGVEMVGAHLGEIGRQGDRRRYGQYIGFILFRGLRKNGRRGTKGQRRPNESTHICSHHDIWLKSISGFVLRLATASRSSRFSGASSSGSRSSSASAAARER